MTMSKLKVVKKSGQEVDFDAKKIEKSIFRANIEVAPENQMTEGRIRLIVEEAEEACERGGGTSSSDDIRELVETRLIRLGSAELAKKYIRHGARTHLLKKSA